MDEKQELVSLLSTDAREDIDDIARQLGTDAETVERLLDELESEGTVRGYQAVIDWDNTDNSTAKPATRRSPTGSPSSLRLNPFDLSPGITISPSR